MADIASAKSSPLLIAAVWAVVVIPASWGFSYTLQNALKIFSAPPPAASMPAPGAPHP
jgi:hypothetical protein